MKQIIGVMIRKKILMILCSLAVSCVAFGQNMPYDEKVDAVKQINQAIKQAKDEGKYVLAQVGGNWCVWCLRFTEFAKKDSVISEIIRDNYIYIHVNYSKANKNPEAMRLLENPARFGFPVFVILDENGRRIHTQNSVYLEESQGYSHKKVVDFLNIWTKKAVETYSR